LFSGGLKKKTTPYKNFQNFGIVCDFILFLSTVSIEKCLFGLINGMIFFPTKKMDVGFEIFHIF